MPLRLRCLTFAFAACSFAAPFIVSTAASAQIAPAVGFGLARETSTALSDALRSKHDARNAQAPNAQDTPPPPVSDREGEVIGFPKGFTYAVDLSSSFPYGDTGEQRNQLPGGFDASLTARLEPRTNAFVEYFQLQPQIEHVDSGSAPIYALNNGKPSYSGTISLAQLNEGVSSKIDAFVIGLQRIFFVGGAAIDGGHPVIFAATYAAVKGDLGGGDLNFQKQFNGGRTLTVQQRVFEEYNANLVVPLSLTEKVTVLYFATGEVLVHPDGFNETNHVQYEQQLLVEYNPNHQTTIFFNPSKAMNYFPTDLYPISTTNFIYGIAHRFRAPSKSLIQPFVQGEVIESNPNNSNGIGVSRLTIVPNQGILPTIGGNKFTTVQLSVGLGTPPLIVPYP